MTINKFRTMKKIKGIINSCLSLVLAITITSCSTYKEVVVSGIPGTTIHNRHKYKIGTIGENGQTIVNINANEPFYLSKAPNSKIYVPFATNVKDNFHIKDAHNHEVQMIGAAIVAGWTFGLLAPVVCQPDKPLDVQTNNDLIK